MTTHTIKAAGLLFRAWTAVTLCALCLMPMALFAQTERPEVLVSLYFASELDACRPNGYRDPNDETPQSCEILTFDDLERLVTQGLAEPVQQSIPPEQVSLGDDLLNSIDVYRNDCPLSDPCMDSSRRYSVILTFEVDAENLLDSEIEILRNPPPNSRVPPYSKNGELSSQGRWINHQRADVFAPGYRVRWLLRIDEWTWDLGTVR